MNEKDRLNWDLSDRKDRGQEPGRRKCANCGEIYTVESDGTVCSDACGKEFVAYLMHENRKPKTWSEDPPEGGARKERAMKESEKSFFRSMVVKPTGLPERKLSEAIVADVTAGHTSMSRYRIPPNTKLLPLPTLLAKITKTANEIQNFVDTAEVGYQTLMIRSDLIAAVGRLRQAAYRIRHTPEMGARRAKEEEQFDIPPAERKEG